MAIDITFEELNEIPYKQSSHFPIIIFGFAVIKDFILDPLVLAITILLPPLGWLLGILVSITFGMALFVWMVSKSSFIQKRMWTWFIRSVLMTILVSFIPVARFIIPEYTLLVLLIHYKEAKFIKTFNKLLELNSPIS